MRNGVVERRAAPVAAREGRSVSGIAVPYNSVTDYTPVPEMFVPGAFKRSLDHKRGVIKVFRGHDVKSPVGLGALAETRDGLDIRVELADTALGDETAREVAAGLLDSFSVGFRAIKDAIVDGVREIREAALHEVSLVALPAYEGARVTSVRADSGQHLLPPRPEIFSGKIVINGVMWG